MSLNLRLRQLLLFTLCLCLVPLESNADLSFLLGNITLFNVNFKSPKWLGRSISVQSNLRIDTEVDPNIQEDSHLNTYSLIHKYGYPAENHTVTTDDGYILTLHRIARPGATPVLLVHGLLDSSATWVMMGPNKGLGYLLYEQGYDVWMANVRGNTYSRKHIKYTHNHAKFWDFTFHEMGVYDIPKTIDYILNKTDFQQLHYVGHSQGTVVFWIMGSERPEYMDKIIFMQALAPVAYLKHCKSPVVNFLAEFQLPVSIVLKLIGVHEFLPKNEFIVMFNQLICDESTTTKEVCSNVIFLTTGFDKLQLNETMLPVVVGHAPAGASTKQMQHFAQVRRSGDFRQFDYGWLRNHWRYNSLTPPEYKLENVKAKVAMYYSQNDWLAQPTDVEALRRRLPNVVSHYLVDYPEFNHLDFIWGVDARELLWDRMIENMRLHDTDNTIDTSN
ncbi:lipase 3 isoform X1 [Drosophila grimshawi]|uniref:GH10411 n=1 Tax=Drosophila grimshawi TaxID=7222 RepID=B4JE91_DROGR|nr:lipase 3 isoform X1 [Drosophila grimshawi]XP_032592361.1 lipase 3 isoform X1 [Drosophila grimshawi]XP_032592362.1 lipase 3 isoform X1 [Drosophila grimshawi]EDW03611.1 GH10411 [Drosophila grimshawi]